jgi:hypothetical protein
LVDFSICPFFTLRGLRKIGVRGWRDMPPFSFYVGERKLMTHSRSHELYDLESHALISFKRSNPYLPPSRGGSRDASEFLKRALQLSIGSARVQEGSGMSRRSERVLR